MVGPRYGPVEFYEGDLRVQLLNPKTMIRSPLLLSSPIKENERHKTAAGYLWWVGK